MIFIAVCIIGFINPSGTVAYTYTVKCLMGNTMDYINEHSHVSFIYLWLNKTYIICYIVTLIILLFPKQKVKLHDVFLFIGLTILSILGIRQLAIFVATLSSIWAKYLNEIKEKILNLKILKGDRLIVLRVFITIICLFLIGNLTYKYYKKYGNSEYVDEADYPVAACEWIIQNLDLENLRIYNNYADGSYMLYAGVPTFVDTRCDLFTAEFNSNLEKGNDIFTDSMQVQDGTKDYKEVFEKYDINAALVSKLFFNIEELADDEDFVNVYEDDYYIVYKKKEQ